MGLTEPREAEARGRPEAGLQARAVTALPASEDGHDPAVAGPALPPPVGATPRDEVLRIANLEIRPAEYQLLADGRRVGLTVREFQTFLVLAERPDRVVTRPEIYALVWGGQMAYRDRSVDVFVRKVRRKLDSAAPGWTYIHTHFGVGYRFSPERVTSR
jgi:DNA-binding response OmpR family regulator